MIITDFKKMVIVGLVIIVSTVMGSSAGGEEPSGSAKTPNVAPPGKPPTEAERKELERLQKDWEERLEVPQHTKIVGGVPARATEFPWAAAIHFYHNSNGWQQYCGGSLIDSDWVLTAAHCPVSRNHIVIIGRTDLASTGGEIHEIEKVIKHANYEPRNNDSDIALIKLKTPSKERPVRLLVDNTLTYAGEETTVIGWGHTMEGGPGSNLLRKVDVAFIQRDICKTNYASINYKITDNMICAGQDGMDSCQGDSGGGLFVFDSDDNNETFHYKLAGVVSFGYGCARGRFPGVYTKVTNYRDWIETTMSSY